MTQETLPYAARVLINGVPKALSYALKKDHRSLGVGSEVLVPLGSRKTRGWVIDRIPLDDALGEVKQPKQLGLLQDKHPLKFVLDAYPCFDKSQLELFEWMAAYYGHPLAEIIDNAVPRRSESRPQKFVRLTEKGKVDLDEETLSKIRKKAPIQAQALEILLDCSTPVAITELESISSSVRSSLKSLEKKGYIENLSLTQFGTKVQKSKSPTADSFPLTTEQQAACDSIFKALDNKSFEASLLFGVTGSGKTEVYLRAIEKALAEGGSALLIVPEISLTPQLFDTFQSRLSSPVAVLHSQVGLSARWSAWEALLQGKIRVALGARSAIFAPMKNLSLIIVDEEHEQSYKQSDGVRYHGRDVAVMRAKFANCPVVLGSATPSFESLLNVKKKRYKLLEMASRATPRPVPEIEIVDLSKIKRRDMPTENISPDLQAAISNSLEKKEQTVILYNRRGFSSYLQCDTCHESLRCPQCSITLTYHKGPKKLLCHYCSISLPPPSHCQLCKDPKTTFVETDAEGKQLATDAKIEKIGTLSHRGAGTERVIDELRDLFPRARILRMDRDTTTKKDAYRDILGQMRKGEADILVGTQMIAKGHDLPGVTLVGVIDADIGLHMPDFRSSEKVFQLITQAAGRAGRGEEPGRVLIQTREPNHPTIVAVSTARFKAFARYQMDQRAKLDYPPWGRMLRVVVSHPDMHEIVRLAKETLIVLRELAERTKSQKDGAIKIGILGPSPAQNERLRGRYRWHLLVKSNSAGALSTIAGDLNRWKKGLTQFGDFRLSVDVDPFDML